MHGASLFVNTCFFFKNNRSSKLILKRLKAAEIYYLNIFIIVYMTGLKNHNLQKIILSNETHMHKMVVNFSLVYICTFSKCVCMMYLLSR